MTQLVIGEHFVGLPGVSHGGYIAGLAATTLGLSVAVTLTRAVPPGSTVVVDRTETGNVLKVSDAGPRRLWLTPFR